MDADHPIHHHYNSCCSGSNSTLNFSSQKDTIDGLVLKGMFSWSRNSILMGTETFEGRYSDKNRMIWLTGLSFSDVTKAGKDSLVLGSYSAVLSQDEDNFSQGTFGSTNSQQIAKLRDNWNASREFLLKNINSPVVYIQVSNDSLIASANAFKKEMESNGYRVNPVEVKNYNYNSDIYYYNSAMQSTATTVQKIYNK